VFGTLVSVLPPTRFDFSTLNEALGGSVSLTLARRIDVTGFTNATLGVRVHAATFTNANDTVQVSVTTDGYTPDDAGRDYGASGDTLAAATIAQSTPVPDYQTQAFVSQSFGALLQVIVIGSRLDLAAGTIAVTLSIDLWLKCRGHVAAPHARRPGTFLGYLPSEEDIRAVEEGVALPSPAAYANFEPRFPFHVPRIANVPLATVEEPAELAAAHTRIATGPSATAATGSAADTFSGGE